MAKHLIVPDTQVKPGVPTQHLEWIGHYILEKRPDVIVHLGDHWDMPSLSSYDLGKKSYEGRRYTKDVDAGNAGLEKLMAPVMAYNRMRAKNKKEQYKPRLVMLRGNHENRINRAVESDAKLDGLMGDHHFNDVDLGWEVVPFLKPIDIDGVRYCHYFPRSANGKVLQMKHGAPNAATQVKREMCSCTSGHLQGLDFAIYQAGNRRVMGLIAGSCYEHDEAYLGEMGNDYWRGVVMKHQVENGDYDPMFVRLDYLKQRYA